MLKSNDALQKLDYVQAPNGARLQASGLDTVFAAALSQFSSVILASFIKGDYEVIATILVTVLYYALPLTINGQTLGKKIYGLRVLPFEDDRSLSWKEALMRETVGKALSSFTMFFGFFMILWRDDRRGLHDLISKTVVVQDAAVAERRTGFFAGVAKSLVVTTVLTCASLSYFYYSSFIADRMEAQLTAQGLKVADVTGSPAKGFVVDGLEVSNENDTINFGKVSINFSDYSKILSGQTLTFSSVVFSNASMSLKEGKGESLMLGLLALPFMKSNDNEEQGQSNKRKPFEFKKIVVKSLVAEGTKIVDSAKTLELRLLQITDLTINPKSKDTSWGNLSIRSSVADLDTGKIELKDGGVKLSSPLSAKIFSVPGVNLRKPIDLVATFSYANGVLDKLQLNALENKITVTAQSGKDYQLWVNSLSPADYIDVLPFDKISFYSSKPSPLDLVTSAPLTASFEIGTGNFIYKQQDPSAANPDSIFAALLGSRIAASHQSADAHYTLTLPPGFLSTLILGGGKIELSSSHNLQPEEILYRLGAKNTQAITKFFVSPHRVPASGQ